MKPSVLIASGCSWTAAKYIDKDPTISQVDHDHVEDLAVVKTYSFAGQLQKRLGLDQLCILAKHGSNNEKQLSLLVNWINEHRDQYGQIFVLWGLTSIYRWEMYSSSTKNVESCMIGKTPQDSTLASDMKYYFSHYWDAKTELRKLGINIVLLHGYLNDLNIEHLFFNAFQSHGQEDFDSKNIDNSYFYHVKENENDLLSLLCDHAGVKKKKTHMPWLNLATTKEQQYNVPEILPLQKHGWLDMATAHPTKKAHLVIADELYDYIKDKKHERI